MTKLRGCILRLHWHNEHYTERKTMSDAIARRESSAPLNSLRDAKHCFHVKVARDVDDQAQNLTGWNQLYDQLSPGKFLGTLTELWLGELQVFQEVTSQAIRQSCEVWPDSLWLGIPMNQDRMGSIGPHSIGEDTIAVRP